MRTSNDIVSISPQKLIHYYNDIYFNLNSEIILKPSSAGITGFDSSWRTIEFDPASAELISFLLPFFDGMHSLRELSERFSFPEQTLLKILQSLYEIGFLGISTNAPIPALSFYNHLISIARSYKARIQENKEEKELDDQVTLKNHLRGKLISLYFLSSSLENHLSDAKSQTNNKELRYKLSHYLSAVYWRSHMLQNALPHLGYSPAEIEELKPIPPVLGMINYLQCLARKDILSYGGCLSLMELPSVSDDYIAILNSEWKKIEGSDLIPCEAIETFKQYQLMNFTGQHGIISEEFFKYALPLPPEKQKEIKENVFTFIQYQVEASKGIKEYYS